MIDILNYSALNLAMAVGYRTGLFDVLDTFDTATVSLMHCMPVGLVDGGPGLGMMWGREKAVEMLKKAGFKQVQVLEMPEDPFNLHYLSFK